MTIGQNESERPVANPKTQGRDPLVQRSELLHMPAELWGNKQALTSPPLLTGGNGREIENALKDLGSRAHAVLGGESNSMSFINSSSFPLSKVTFHVPTTRGCSVSESRVIEALGLDYCPIHILPLWLPLRVVSPQEFGPTSPRHSFYLVSTGQPGARMQAPTLGLAQGWCPSCAPLSNVTALVLSSIICIFSARSILIQGNSIK